MTLFRFNFGLTTVLGSFVCDALSVGEAVEFEGSRMLNCRCNRRRLRDNSRRSCDSDSYCNADTLHNAGPSYPILQPNQTMRLCLYVLSKNSHAAARQVSVATELRRKDVCTNPYAYSTSSTPPPGGKLPVPSLGTGPNSSPSSSSALLKPTSSSPNGKTGRSLSDPVDDRRAPGPAGDFVNAAMVFGLICFWVTISVAVDDNISFYDLPPSCLDSHQRFLHHRDRCLDFRHQALRSIRYFRYH